MCGDRNILEFGFTNTNRNDIMKKNISRKVELKRKVRVVMNESEKQKMRNFNRGTLWMNYVMRFRFPIGIIRNVLALLAVIVMQIVYKDFSFVLTFLPIVYLIINVWGYSAACELTPKGYSTLQVIFPIEILIRAFDYAFASIMDHNIIYGIGTFVVYVIIGGLAWWLPNAIYFEKRKSLFVSPLYSAYPKKYDPEKYKSWNCSKCGRTNSSHVEECPVCKQKKPLTDLEVEKNHIKIVSDVRTCSNIWTCSKCHTDNSPTLRYCSNCGERQPKENLDIAKTNNSTNTADGLRNKKIVEEKPEITQSKNTITADGIEIIRPKIIKKEESSPVSPTLDNDFESKKQEPIIDDKVDEVQSTDEIAENESAESNEELAFCRKCGTQLLNDSVFCHKCGCKKVF